MEQSISATGAMAASAAEELQFTSVSFKKTIKSAEQLVTEFYIPPRKKGVASQESFHCPCNGNCGYSFRNNGNGKVAELAQHIACRHLHNPPKYLVDELKSFLDNIIKGIRDSRKLSSIQKYINAFDLTFEKCKKKEVADQVPVSEEEIDVDGSEEVENEPNDVSDHDAAAALQQAADVKEDDPPKATDDGAQDDLLLQEGLEHVRSALAEAKRSVHKHIDPPQARIEQYLNKFELLRKNVTDLAGPAFDSHEGKDLYTMWSQNDYDELVSSGGGAAAVGHTAFDLRGSSKTSTDGGDLGADKDKDIAVVGAADKGKRYYECDHIWEVQLLAIAIRETQRFGDRYQLTLTQLIYVFDSLNQLQNMNATPWKLNLYKGKLMKRFKDGYQVTHSSSHYTLEAIIQGNATYRRIFLKRLPLPDDGDGGGGGGGGGARSGTTVISHVKAAVKQVLVEHFYVKFFVEQEDPALRMLYAVMCSMFEAMFPAELEENREGVVK